MNHRLPFLLGILLIVVAAQARAESAKAPDAPKKPNVLFIAVDDLRDWVGYLHHNEQTKTPNIDRLAKMGMAFSHSYCAAPVCNPSRTALMSGRRPFSTGVYENNNDWRPVIPEPQTLTHQFRAAGYFVCGAGKIYHESYRRLSDWDDYLQNEGGLPKVSEGQSTGVGGIRFAPLDCKDEDLNDYKITDYGIAQLGKKHDKPFFLAVGLHKPHMPWNVPRKYYDMFPADKIILPPYLENDLDDIPPAGIRMAHPETDHIPMLKSGRWKEAVQGYLAAIAYTDMNIGRLLDAFDKSAYKDNTIICFWCDHGWHLGEKHHWRKFALWEEATRSPLIWVVPGITKAGGISQRTVDFMSIYPTLCDLAGLPIPSHVEGKSIRTLLSDPNAYWSTPAITTYRFKNHTVRTEDWRLIRYENGDEEFYDEKADPNEWTNLAQNPKYAGQKANLAKLLPDHNQPDVGGGAGKGAEDFGDGTKAEKKRLKKEARQQL